MGLPRPAPCGASTRQTDTKKAPPPQDTCKTPVIIATECSQSCNPPSATCLFVHRTPALLLTTLQPPPPERPLAMARGNRPRCSRGAFAHGSCLRPGAVVNPTGGVTVKSPRSSAIGGGRGGRRQGECRRARRRLRFYGFGGGQGGGRGGGGLGQYGAGGAECLRGGGADAMGRQRDGGAARRM